jgi:hypothetical protein
MDYDKTFIEYAEAIKEILLKNPDGLSIREIHDYVGRDHLDWTMDALEFIMAESRGTGLSRYYIPERNDPRQWVSYNEWVSKQVDQHKRRKQHLSRLFVNSNINNG